MRFGIAIEGTHIEGHEGKTRFDKIVADFLANLDSNGFKAEGVVASHDADSVVVQDVGEPNLTPAEVTEAVEGVTETVGEQAASLTVNFASDTAAELADSHNLTDTDFAGIEPSGAKGFTKADVERAIEASEA